MVIPHAFARPVEAVILVAALGLAFWGYRFQAGPRGAARRVAGAATLLVAGGFLLGVVWWGLAVFVFGRMVRVPYPWWYALATTDGFPSAVWLLAPAGLLLALVGRRASRALGILGSATFVFFWARAYFYAQTLDGRAGLFDGVMIVGLLLIVPLLGIAIGVTGIVVGLGAIDSRAATVGRPA